MGKAVISNCIYMDLPPDKKKLFDSLTYRISNNAPNPRFEQVEVIRNYRMVTPSIVSIPQGRSDLIPPDYEIIDRRVLEFADFPAPNFPLLDEQKIVYDEVDSSCLINALPGWGKTFTALHVARKLGQKTLIITHTTALRDQWVEEVEKLYGFTPGIIGSGKSDYNSPLVIGNVQSLTKVANNIGKMFGTAILDECLDYETSIDTLEYGNIKLGVLVNNKKPAHVLSMNTDTQEVSYKKVLNYFKNPSKPAIRISHSGGGSIKCTRDHSLFTYLDGEIYKVPADTLEVGDSLLVFENGYMLSIETIEKIEPTNLQGGFRYNIEVEDNHTYFANGILVSNCHHAPASTFTNILNESHARYRIGLTGTLKRKDGKHILFTDYFGDVVYKPPQNNTVDPIVYLMKTGIRMPPGSTWADRLTKLLSDAEYQDLIASIALVQARKGHKVLIIASRVDFLQKVAKMLGDRAIVVVGETENRKEQIQKIYDNEADYICGSRQIFSEGLSVNPLSCVILAEPSANPSNLEQIIGRVMRLHPGKLDPIAIDMQFSGATETRQNSIRIGFYLEKGWEMKVL